MAKSSRKIASPRNSIPTNCRIRIGAVGSYWQGNIVSRCDLEAEGHDIDKLIANQSITPTDEPINCEIATEESRRARLFKPVALEHLVSGRHIISQTNVEAAMRLIPEAMQDPRCGCIAAAPLPRNPGEYRLVIDDWFAFAEGRGIDRPSAEHAIHRLAEKGLIRVEEFSDTRKWELRSEPGLWEWIKQENNKPAQEEAVVPPAIQDTIWYHGVQAYSTDRQHTVAVTEAEHAILQAFLDKTISLSTFDLNSRPHDISNPADVIAKMKKKYEGRFNPAMSRPGGKGKGGYSIRVKSLLGKHV